MTEVTEHGTTGYRYGCRCSTCREAHAAADKKRRRNALYEDGGLMGPQVRRAILAELKASKSVPAAAEAVGVTHQRVYAAAKALPDFGAKVDRLTRP